MPCAVLLPQCAKGPAQRVTAVVFEHIERSKAWAFRQEAATTDAVAQRGVLPLQKSNRGRDAVFVTAEVVEEKIDASTAVFQRQLQGFVAHLAQRIRRQQVQHQ